MNCPLCRKHAETERGLKKHLMGLKKYGGHEIPEYEADKIAFQTASQIDGETLQPIHRMDKAPASLIPINKSPQNNHFQFSSDQPFAKFLEDVFSSLALNKRLPKYQFERRIDALLNVFLPEILSGYFGAKVEVVVPEFPLKCAHNNQSTNADYLLFRHSGQKYPKEAWLLFELKTDDSSVRLTQFDIYMDALEKGMPQLWKDVETIRRASKQPAKYGELLRRMAGFPLERDIELVYITPAEFAHHGDQTKIHCLTFSDLQEIHLCNYSEAWEMFKAIILPTE